MGYLVTLGDLRNSRIPAALGVCSTDARLIPWTNEAQERLIYEGKWIGTYSRVRICSSNGCITLPRGIATIERAAVCGMVIPVHDVWWEFLETGLGPSSCGSGCSGWPQAQARGYFPTIDDIHGSNKKLRWQVDVIEDVGKEALFLGYDDNGNWIRTEQDGVLKDGQIIVGAQSPGTDSVNYFAVVQNIQLPDDMEGQSFLYEVNTAVSPNTTRLIGQFQYDETRPSYPRYFIPTLGNCCNGTDNGSGGCTQRMVEAIVKLDLIPVKNDTDYLIIGNIPAMKEMMVAIKNAENEMDSITKNQILMSGMAVAKNILNGQLAHYLGDGRDIGIALMGSSVGYIDPVQNFI